MKCKERAKEHGFHKGKGNQRNLKKKMFFLKRIRKGKEKQKTKKSQGEEMGKEREGKARTNKISKKQGKQGNATEIKETQAKKGKAESNGK